MAIFTDYSLELSDAVEAYNSGDLDGAEARLSEHLSKQPHDAGALDLLAEIFADRGRFNIAETLLLQSLSIQPIPATRRHYANVLLRAKRPQDALIQIDHLLSNAPDDLSFTSAKAVALAQLGKYDEAALLYEKILDVTPDDATTWLNYGHVLKKSGRAAECEKVYRKAVTLDPAKGEAWWLIANLRTSKFTDADLEAMSALAVQPTLASADRAQVHYALGKALEERGRYEESFSEYSAGARIRGAAQSYDRDGVDDLVRRTTAFFTAETLAATAANPVAPVPIFVIGLPRSGSTLIEQILSSHSQIEGLGELLVLGRIARRLARRGGREQARSYPNVLTTLSESEIASIGVDYLQAIEVERQTQTPFIVDKMLSNFFHIGLILRTLPNARIIDARRHPVATCFSAYKHYFANGHGFSYSFEDLAHHYRTYIRLTAHFDRIAPGRIHRVVYEDMVADTENQVRRLLAYCGVPFEHECLRFFENDRVARTASSEQVRRPIFTDAVDHWRNYEPWLQPLKQALGSTLESYPNAPDDLV